MFTVRAVDADGQVAEATYYEYNDALVVADIEREQGAIKVEIIEVAR